MWHIMLLCLLISTIITMEMEVVGDTSGPSNADDVATMQQVANATVGGVATPY
jgi:hypothetical protein